MALYTIGITGTSGMIRTQNQSLAYELVTDLIKNDYRVEVYSIPVSIHPDTKDVVEYGWHENLIIAKPESLDT